MKFLTKILIPVFALASMGTVEAQTTRVNTDKNLVYRQPKSPWAIDTYAYNSYWSNAKEAYNLKGLKMSSAPGEIISLKVNPAGYSFAVLAAKGNNRSISIFDINRQGSCSGQLKDLPSSVTAICYTPDSRQVAAANGGRLMFYSAADLAPEGSMAISPGAQALTMDEGDYYVAVAYPDRVEIYNRKDGSLRKTLPLASAFADFGFSPAGDRFGILMADGALAVYDSRDFSLGVLAEGLGSGHSMSFHPDGKYVAVATGNNAVTFVNLTDSSDRPMLADTDGPRNFVRFVNDGKSNLYLVYDTPSAIKYKRISGFQPNYTKLMRDELNARMREWAKMRPMETEEEYALRVTPESMERQKRLFANEISTSLAGDLISHANVTLGRYNPDNGLLTVNMGNLPAIYLKVPQGDVAGFGDGSGLQFSNAVYGITPDDRFELIYVDVYNPVNGKSYAFDNLDRNNLDFLQTDDSFVSLDLIRQSSREDVVLKGIKNSIVDEARKQGLISEHTVINVETAVVPSYDASGNRISNYKVDFAYTVDAGFSAREDFPAGKYRIDESNAAASMLRIIGRAFETDFAGYLAPGKKFNVTITGSADALPINGKIAYDGSFGEFVNEPARIDGTLSAITVMPSSGIRTNEQLAFMRAQALRDGMKRINPKLDSEDSRYNYNIEVSKDKGGEYRRISVSFTFVDAF